MEKVSVFIKMRVLFWPEISALGVFFNFDNERIRPPKYQSDSPGMNTKYSGKYYPLPHIIGNFLHALTMIQTQVVPIVIDDEWLVVSWNRLDYMFIEAGPQLMVAEINFCDSRWQWLDVKSSFPSTRVASWYDFEHFALNQDGMCVKMTK